MANALVADDDDDIRTLVVRVLTDAGFTVQDVADGSAALAAARANPPDVVVLDVMMPGMTGIEVCRHLRAEPAGARMVIVLLTACALPQDVEAGYAAGADDYILKPFSPRELASRVRRAFERLPA